MKKTYLLIICFAILISILCGCQQSTPGKTEEKSMDSEMTPSDEGEIKLDIINNNRYADIEGFNAPTGKVGYVIEDGMYYVRLMEGFSLPDEGDIYLFVSEKANVLNAEDLKDSAYEVSILKNKEGNHEYRLSENIPADKINSVIFYNKNDNALVAWAFLK